MRIRIPNGVRPFLIVAVAGGLLSGACGLGADQQDPWALPRPGSRSS
jgi:hypothetical protein